MGLMAEHWMRTLRRPVEWVSSSELWRRTSVCESTQSWGHEQEH